MNVLPASLPPLLHLQVKSEMNQNANPTGIGRRDHAKAGKLPLNTEEISPDLPGYISLWFFSNYSF